jgi:hypothetical protein
MKRLGLLLHFKFRKYELDLTWEARGHNCDRRLLNRRSRWANWKWRLNNMRQHWSLKQKCLKLWRRAQMTCTIWSKAWKISAKFILISIGVCS